MIMGATQPNVTLPRILLLGMVCKLVREHIPQHEVPQRLTRPVNQRLQAASFGFYLCPSGKQSLASGGSERAG